MGYAGLVNSFAIEFDTNKNGDLGDLDNNHVSFHGVTKGQANSAVLIF